MAVRGRWGRAVAVRRAAAWGGLTAMVLGCGGSNGGVGSFASSGTRVSPSLYVVQESAPSPPQSGTSILEIPAASSGSVAPAVVLTPPTGLAIYSVATDSSGNVYVGGNDAGGALIAIYSAGTTRTILGPATGLATPAAFAIDGSGQLYESDSGSLAIEVFAAGASGNVAPVRTIQGGLTGLTAPLGIAVDAAGNIYVCNAAQVFVFAAGANGNVAPARKLSPGIGTAWGVTIDSVNNLYVASNNLGAASAIQIYSAGTSGSLAAVRTITGNNTGFHNPQGIQVDTEGNVYVLDVSNTAGVPDNPVVEVFPAGATGNEAPTRTITSPEWTNAGYGGLGLY